MLTLLFPTADVLRLALTSGVVPPDVAGRPVRAMLGERGEIWLTTPAPEADALARLAHLGIRPHAKPPGDGETVHHCWAAALPLSRVESVDGSPAIFELPASRVSAFAAALRRLGSPPSGVALHGSTAHVRVDRAPAYALSVAAAYRPVADRVWARHGWSHPLPSALATIRSGLVALVDPPNLWRCVDATERRRIDRYDVCSESVPSEAASLRVLIGVPLHLRKTSAAAVETLWTAVIATDQWRDLFADTDPRTLRLFEYATVAGAGRSTRLVLRCDGPRPPVLSGALRGYVSNPVTPWLHLPSGYALSPTPRADRLAALFNPNSDAVVWVERDPAGRPQFHRAATAAFRPLAELLRYVTRSPQPVQPRRLNGSPFALATSFSVHDEASDPDDPGLAASYGSMTKSADGEPSGWLSRIAGKLFGPNRQPRHSRAAQRRAKATEHVPPVGSVAEMSSTPTHLTARRAELEQSVLTRGGRDCIADARVWAELAGVYAEIGHQSDAAVCWLNALWDHPHPPREWAVQWLAVETKWAKTLPEANRREARARIAAAELVVAGNLPASTRRLLDLASSVEGAEAELPVRAVWLARSAVATTSGGDPLSLATCRDRLFARLAGDGAAVDLDAPSVLRFQSTADGDRFRAAADWLVRVREPIHRWLDRQTTGSRLGWAGLDPDVRASTAYADLMLAWGLTRLGDRTRAESLMTTAGAALTRCGGTGVDPAVHAALLARFRERIRVARSARDEKPGAAVPAAFDRGELSAYAVDKLVSRSHILGGGPADPYRGVDLAGFLGSDPFGVRLGRLATGTNLADSKAALAEASGEPTANVLPRTLLAVGEACGADDVGIADRILRWTPRTLELLPEGVRLACPPGTDGRSQIVRLSARCLDVAARLAVRHHLSGSFGALLQFLGETVTENEPLRAAVGRSAITLFRAVRKLGLAEAATTLLANGPADAAEWATGWFLLGRNEQGVRLLDETRERLFVSGVEDVRRRTAVAIGYTAGLAHAPQSFALGRLEELFQRLGEVASASAAARYYALGPLELIDATVTAVVSDDFNLGPHVRGWLDDDEFVMRRRITRDLAAALSVRS